MLNFCYVSPRCEARNRTQSQINTLQMPDLNRVLIYRDKDSYPRAFFLSVFYGRQRAKIGAVGGSMKSKKSMIVVFALFALNANYGHAGSLLTSVSSASPTLSVATGAIAPTSVISPTVDLGAVTAVVIRPETTVVDPSPIPTLSPGTQVQAPAPAPAPVVVEPAPVAPEPVAAEPVSPEPAPAPSGGFEVVSVTPAPAPSPVASAAPSKGRGQGKGRSPSSSEGYGDSSEGGKGKHAH